MAKSSPTPKPALGLPWAEFEASVDAIEQLQRTGKFQLYLARENVVRIIGETDEFRMALGKRLGTDPLEKAKAELCLNEVLSSLQVLLSMNSLKSAVRIFEQNVYEDEFEAAKDNQALREEFRRTIQKKLELVSSKLALPSFSERSRRLNTIVGPSLEDVDVDIVSRRYDATQGVNIEAPFLKLRLRYSSGGDATLPFAFPPWLLNPPRSIKAFEIECDETDIDLLVSRLLKAKELLRQSLEAKVDQKTA